jgi:AmmeMemoRadiSam system protein A
MSLPSEFSPPASAERIQEYSSEERAILLRAAHQSIVSATIGHTIPPGLPSAHLSQPRGVFTTLYHNRVLRGCVGYPLAVTPLYRAVVETARAAAFEDPRFPPVPRDETYQLKISLSVLSPLMPVSAEEVEVGRHGLLISQGSRHGLLLPQVAVEHGWDRETFLEQTCRKGGMAVEEWRRGARIEVFTAEVFGDENTRK